MKKSQIASLLLMAVTSVSMQAQDLNQAIKAIDAEKFEEAKNILNKYVAANPQDGKAVFLLGNVYMRQDVADSASIAFNRSIQAKDDSNYGYIGLGQIALNANNATSAKSNFDTAVKGMRKKDTDEYIYVAKAYLNADTPNYKAAIEVLKKGLVANSMDPIVNLTLGDAYFGDNNHNDAYSAYRDAYTYDNTLVRARVQQGVLLKGARAFDQAVSNFKDVLATNPNYGPAYRELAETYYLWAINDRKNYTKHIASALDSYKKYMDMTDRSLSSRMRYADFLILAKEYTVLEQEAQSMKELEAINPRILRYLGYASYENGNNAAAIESLEKFVNTKNAKLIARDYMYLGLAYLKSATTTETVDQPIFDKALTALQKSVEMDPKAASDLSEVGQKFFSDQSYKNAAAIYEIAAKDENSSTFIQDVYYLGYAYYMQVMNTETPNEETARKAIAAFEKVSEKSPTTQDAYYFKARVASKIDDNQLMADAYQAYAAAVELKGEAEIAKPATQSKLVEAYNTLGSFYGAMQQKDKAREFFNKTLKVKAGDEFATQGLRSL